MAEQPTKITKAAVDRLSPGEMVWDAEIRGFGVRCQRRDRVYMVKYRSQGRQRWFTIGKHGSPWTPELARRRPSASSALWPRARTRPTRSRRTAPPHSRCPDRPLPGGARGGQVQGPHLHRVQALVERIVKPELGRLKVDEVRSSDIERLHLKFRATPYQANRLVALLSKMFNWSGRRGERNPCVGIERFAEQKRRRYLSSAELARLGAALSRADEERLTSPLRHCGHPAAGVHGRAADRDPDAAVGPCRPGAGLSQPGRQQDRSQDHLPECRCQEASDHPAPPGRQPFVVPGERQGRHLVNLEKPWRKIRAGSAA
jgi:hypothetical protein